MATISTGVTSPGVVRSGPGRKSRACAEYRKQKLRCDFLPGDRKCRHCLRRNITCVSKHGIVDDAGGNHPHGSQLLSGTGLSESTAGKIDLMREEIRRLSENLDQLLHRGAHIVAGTPAVHLTHVAFPSHPSPVVHASISPVKTVLSLSASAPREDNTHMAMTRENSVDPNRDHDDDLVDDNEEDPVTVEDPMGSLYEVTRLRNIRSNRSKTARVPLPGPIPPPDDFISRGVISVSEAESLFQIFRSSLNHYLWVGLEQTHADLDAVRRSSELLAATILAVTALHVRTSATTFDVCYAKFLALISGSMFSRYHAVDDVRALCIAGFWLSDVSWKLSGHALRIATELNMHQAYARLELLPPNTNTSSVPNPTITPNERDNFLKARLWYMLYACDAMGSGRGGPGSGLWGSVTSDRHLLYHIAAGLEKMLEKISGAVVEEHETGSGGTGQVRQEEKRGDEVSTSQPLPSRHDAEHYNQSGRSSGMGYAVPEQQAWSSYQVPEPGILLNDLTVMNDSWICEGFRNDESSNDVYNLLASQFSHQ